MKKYNNFLHVAATQKKTIEKNILGLRLSLILDRMLNQIISAQNTR